MWMNTSVLSVNWIPNRLYISFCGVKVIFIGISNTLSIVRELSSLVSGLADVSNVVV